MGLLSSVTDPLIVTSPIFDQLFVYNRQCCLLSYFVKNISCTLNVYFNRWDVLLEILEAQKLRISRLGVQLEKVTGLRTKKGEE